jgi:hypothetical protein
MGSLVSLARRTDLVPMMEHLSPKAPRQLDLVLDDVQLRCMTAAERQAVLRSLARLMLEANGIATGEVGDDHA